MLHLQQLAYVSKVQPGTSKADERRIVGIAKRNNRRAGLTGILASSGSHFLQIVEGTRAAVDALMLTIRTDTRHIQPRVILDRTINTRQYASWSMGYVFNLDLTDELAALHSGRMLLDGDALLAKFPASELTDTVFGLPSAFGRLSTGRSI